MTNDFEVLEAVPIDLPDLNFDFLTPELEKKVIDLQKTIEDLQMAEMLQFNQVVDTEIESQKELLVAGSLKKKFNEALLLCVPELELTASQYISGRGERVVNLVASQEDQDKLRQSVKTIHDQANNQLKKLRVDASVGLPEARAIASEASSSWLLPHANAEPVKPLHNLGGRYFIKSQILANTCRFLGFQDSADYLDARIFKEKYVLLTIARLARRYHSALTDVPKDEIKKTFEALIRYQSALKGVKLDKLDLDGIEDIEFTYTPDTKQEVKVKLLDKFAEISEKNGSKFLAKTCKQSATVAKNSLLAKTCKRSATVAKSSLLAKACKRPAVVAKSSLLAKAWKIGKWITSRSQRSTTTKARTTTTTTTDKDFVGKPR